MSDVVLLFVVAIPLIVGELLALGEVAFMRRDLSPARRIGWIAFLVAVPYVSLLAYVVTRPPRPRPAVPADRSTDDHASSLVSAMEELVDGQIDVDEYRSAIASRRWP